MNEIIPQGWMEVSLREILGAMEGGVSVNSENRKKGVREFGVLKTSSISGGRFYPEEHKTILTHQNQHVE